MSAAITEAGGDYGAVIVSGENHAFDPSAMAIPPGCRIVLTQNEMAPGLLPRLSAAARAAGAEFWLNLAPAEKLGAALSEGLADVLVVNRVEAGDLLGREVGDARTAVVALGRIAPATDCILTLGDKGVIMATREGEVLHLPAPEVQVISTHGAGDVFCGALAAARLAGAEWPDALDRAQTAAGRHVAQIR